MSDDHSLSIGSSYLQTARARIAGEMSASFMKAQAEADRAVADMLAEQAALMKALTYGGDGRPSLPAVGTSVDLLA